LSEDKKTWTFTIRENARYWNGDRVTAPHIRDSWLAMIDPKADAPYSSLFDFIDGAKEYRTGKLADTSKIGIEVKGDRTLIVRLAAPAAYFPRVLCHHSFAPVHPAMLRTADWSRVPVISNGPYYISERGADRLVLERNQRYWDLKRVAIPKIVIRFVEDGAAAAALYDTAEAQWIAGNIDLDALKDRRGISVNPMFATHYYYVRSAEKPWSDRRVRRALSLVLPWTDIREGQLLPAQTLVYPIPDYPKLEGAVGRDGEEAKKLLAEAGYAGGAGMPDLVIRITPSEDAARIAALMSAAWKNTLGVPVKVEVVEFEDYYASMQKDDYVVGSSTWIGDFADPYTFLQMWRADSNLNDAGYNDPEYETLIDRSLIEEGEARYNTLAEAEKLLLDGGVVLPISYTPALNIIDTEEIDGWYPNPLDMHPFKYLSFAAFRPLPGVAMAEKVP
jgi:peptide/nickel transport system substrate-binding protein/oligopeptide transport system substrate-binding protein